MQFALSSVHIPFLMTFIHVEKGMFWCFWVVKNPTALMYPELSPQSWLSWAAWPPSCAFPSLIYQTQRTTAARVKTDLHWLAEVFLSSRKNPDPPLSQITHLCSDCVFRNKLLDHSRIFASLKQHLLSLSGHYFPVLIELMLLRASFS